jgi:L-fucose mutarotase
MLRFELLQPQILKTLAAAGHGSTVLIADGNYPATTCLGSRARLVSLNLSPGIVGCADVLKAVLTAIPIEAAHVMQPSDGSRPAIWAEFESILAEAGVRTPLAQVERFEFYRVASSDQHVLTIQTAEQRTYANLQLTIGVRRD